jgi:glutathione S-transferase
MTKPILYIGDKNKSSWSLRPWLAMKQAGVQFDERVIALDRSDSADKIRAVAPFGSGKVPVLVDGDVVVWESLAICEYVAERWAPSLWPRDQAARAHARAIAHEMHAGFAALRQVCPMNLKYQAEWEDSTLNPIATRDIVRVTEIWRETRERWGGGGPFLFGADFTIADAMYAPVVSRFTTYSLPADDVGRAYLQTIWRLPAMQEWKAAALAEP